MILVLAGTRDGRRIAGEIRDVAPVLATAATDYGGRLLAEAGIEALSGRLDTRQMVDICRQRGVDLIIDATHPFAVQVSEQAMDAASRLGVEYIRFERAAVEAAGCRVIAVDTFREAAVEASRFQRIFLAVGSRHLKEMLEVLDGAEGRVVARLLPDQDYVMQALDLGLKPSQIVGIQGPFTRDLNRALLEHYGADVLVTKASGKAGGLDTKLKAATDLGLPVVMVRRPRLDYPLVAVSLTELTALLEQRLKNRGAEGER